MFGSVPKNLWSRKIAADLDNCIGLTTRSLLLRSDKRLILIDVGMGDMWSEKEVAVFGIQNRPISDLPFLPENVTDIILTHLHFDHAGGIARSNAGIPTLAYPNATLYLQRSNLEYAQCPTAKERASYLERIVKPVKEGRLSLIEGTSEIFPGVTVHRVDGHTIGQQWIEISCNNCTYMFVTDMIPTAHHLPLPYHMGYDSCATSLLAEKDVMLKYAVDKRAIVVFEHDRDTAACTVGIDDRGHYCLKERVAI